MVVIVNTGNSLMKTEVVVSILPLNVFFFLFFLFDLYFKLQSYQKLNNIILG